MPTFQEALRKAASFCAYQERTPREVRQRLADWEVPDEMAEEVIAELMAQQYLSEARFARTFAGGKFRVKRWGKQKIKFELQRKGISGQQLDEALGQIPSEDYTASLRHLLEKKLFELRQQPPLAQQQKAARYALSKGYESELVFSVLKKLLAEK
jgi:regulatory protein